MMNSTNSTCFGINVDFPKIFLPTVYIMVFISGLLGNCWGLKSIWANWRKLGNIKIFALNLCIADILYLITLPLMVLYQLGNQKWLFGQPFCKITRFLFNVNLYGSIGFLTCISVYRYLSIAHTLKVKGRIKIRHSIGISALVWIVLLLQCLPDVFFDKTYNKVSKCYDSTTARSATLYLKYSITQAVIGFLIPLMIMMCSYGHIAVILVTRKDMGDKELKMKCLRLVIILTMLFAICFIPIHVFRNLNLMTRISKNQTGKCEPWFPSVYIAKQTSDGLASLNCAINPLVYLLNHDKLMKRWLSFRKKTRNVSESLTCELNKSTM